MPPNDETLALFLEESRGHVAAMSQCLLALEGDPANAEEIHRFFRAAHTLKGMAAAMGYDPVAALAHRLEDVLAASRDAGAVESGDVDLLLAAVDAIEVGVEESAAGSAPDAARFGDLVARLEERERGLRAPHATDITITFADDCVAPGARAIQALRALEPHAAVEAVEPLPHVLDSTGARACRVRVVPRTTLAQALAALSSVPDVVPRVGAPKTQAAPKGAPTGPSAAPARALPPAGVRVASERLDALLDTVGELVVAKNRLSLVAVERKDPVLRDALHEAHLLLTDLTAVTRSLRLIPLGRVFDRFPRMVRDVLRAQGKEADLVIDDGGVEVDRSVADGVAEAVVHLLRNAISHGLETPLDRAAAGKYPRGTLRLVARRRGGEIEVEVADDGRGVDVTTVVDRALAKGLLAGEAASRVTEGNVLEILTLPGFSTANEVDATSGRGVGMDVVRRMVESLQGRMELVTAAGEGTTVQLHLPVNVTIFPAMIVGLGPETFALPLHAVEGILSVSPGDVRSGDAPTVDTKEGPVRLVALRAVFHWPLPDLQEDVLLGLVVRAHGERFAVLVDEVLGQEEIVAKPLDKSLYTSRLASGAAILGSGAVAPILDVDTIAQAVFLHD